MMTRTVHSRYAESLNALQLGDSITMRDSHHYGVTIVRGPNEWIVVDLENGGAEVYDRLRVVKSDIDGDDSGLNQICVGCDFDAAAGLWLIPNDIEIDAEFIQTVWDSDDAF